MARPLRIEYSNASYHVSNSGGERKRVFADAATRELFLQGVEEAASRFNVRVHAWALLSNQYHLLLTTPEGNLSRFMRQLDGVFTQNYQKNRRNKGSVFRARYKAVLLQADGYLAPMSVFLHQKAVSANADSSLPLYLSAGKGPEWFDKIAVLDQAGLGARQTAAYRALVEAPGNEELARFYGRRNQLSILGNEAFRASAKRKLASSRAKPGSGQSLRGRPSVKAVVSKVAEQYKVDEKSIYKAARGPGSRNLPRWVAMYLCQEVAGVTLQVIASRFGLKRYGTVSTTIGKLKAEMAENPRTATQVRKLQAGLSAGK